MMKVTFPTRGVKKVILAFMFILVSISSVWAGICTCRQDVGDYSYDVSWVCGSTGSALFEVYYQGEYIGYFYKSISYAETFCNI